MTIDQSSAATRTPTTREQRGLQLFRDHAGEITQIAPWTYAVPSCSGDGIHQVHIRDGREACTCRDFEHHGDDSPCKHIYAAILWRAKSGECADCKTRKLRRELVEVGPDHLTWFEDDALCWTCAGKVGIR